MSMSTRVVGFRPADDIWEKHKAVWNACKAAGVLIPDETFEFFNGEPPGDKPGMEIDINEACTEYQNVFQAGYEVDISKLPKDVTIIRFLNSW